MMLSAQKAALKIAVKTVKCLDGSKMRSLAARSIRNSSGSSGWALCAVATTQQQQQQQEQSNWGQHRNNFLSATALALLALGATTASGINAHCEIHAWTPVSVGTGDLQCNYDDDDDEANLERLPVYTSDQVAERNGEDGKPVWVSYGGVVYDVTQFIANHPGGSEKIMTAAGSAVEPFWFLYRQHFASDLPMRLMERMVVGRLAEDDQERIDDQLTSLQDNDPYAKEPARHHALVVHSDQPMNAECPSKLLAESYLTPSSLFYIRHHHPVPLLTQLQLKNYQLEVDLTAYGKGVLYLSLDDLKSMDKVEVTATLQCSGNRRDDFNQFQRTSGTAWGQGAISNAKWGGVRLSEVLKRAGLDDPIAAEEKFGLEHIRFHALDGMSASIGIEKALNPYGDVIICYEMNGEPLPRDHGFPLRVIVPGYAAVRNVKWLSKIEVAKTEADGPWQRGLNYKTLPPSVTDASGIDLDRMPSMTEASLFSGITHIKPLEPGTNAKPGDRITVQAKGWAWAGGGRNVVRVDITGDDGATWATANIKQGGDQRFGRAWAWVLWEGKVAAVVRDDGSVQLASKAVDLAFNVQPEKCDHTWNVRGLGNNSWYRASTKVR